MLLRFWGVHRKPASSLDTEGQTCKTEQGRREDGHLPERMTSSLHPPELTKLSVAENSWRIPVPKKEWGETPCFLFTLTEYMIHMFHFDSFKCYLI